MIGVGERLTAVPKGVSDEDALAMIPRTLRSSLRDLRARAVRARAARDA